MIKKIKSLLKKEKNEQKPIDIHEKINNMYNSLDTENIYIVIGSDLVDFSEIIRNCLDKFRNSIKDEYGFIFPAIRIRDNIYIQGNELKIYVQNKEVIQVFFIPTEEKIEEEFNKNLKKLFHEHIDKIFTCEIMERYIKLVQNKNSYLISNLTTTYNIVELKEIFITILKNKKSIKNISYIMEQIGEICLSDGSPYHKSSQKTAEELLKIL